jgi:hypothetical protein
MSISNSSVIIKAFDCECEFSVNIILKEIGSSINKFNITANDQLVKKVNIFRMCHYHEQQLRNKTLKEIKRNNNNALYEIVKPILTDLSIEIK